MNNRYTLPKITALLVFVFATVLMHAQSADSTTRFCKVSLTNGTHVTGQFISEDSANVVIRNQALGTITVLKSNVESVQATETGNTYSFVMSSGQTYRGVVTAQNEHEITVKTSNGSVKLISANITDFMGGTPQTAEEDFDHASRYVFAPSAVPLRKGEGYYQNMMVLVNGVQYGITDQFSLGAGVVAPVGFFATAKYGKQVGRNVHVAAGGMFISSMYGLNLGLGCGFGSFTFGNRRTNTTVTLGYGAMTNGDSWEMTKRPIINISGVVKVTEGLSLITENYFFPVKDRFRYNAPADAEVTYSYRPQLSAGFRLAKGPHAFDFAATNIGSMEHGNLFIIPWFSYTFHFKRKSV